MGLLEQIFSVFGLGYTIALVKLKQDDNFSRSDKAFIAVPAAFLVLSVVSCLIQVLSIPWGYKCRFFWKSLLRGLLAPLLALLYYPILFYSKGCVKWALTFSNEACDGVERTRQVSIFELIELGSRAQRFLTAHTLIWYGEEKKWGYRRLVGEIWVKVRFEAQFNVDTSRKLQTSDLGTRLLLQYERDTASQQGPEPVLEVSTGSVNVPRANQESVKVSCLHCVCVDLESGSNPGTPSGTLPATPPTPQPPPTSPAPQQGFSFQAKFRQIYQNLTFWASSLQKLACAVRPTRVALVQINNKSAPPTPTSRNPPEQYAVTISRSREMFRECWLIPAGCTWNLKCTVVRKWTLFQIHQYMLCLDVWGNQFKQGIWKSEEPKTRCSGCTSCCNNACSTNQAARRKKFRYCYRHDELINAIDKGKRITKTSNNGTWYTVV